MIRLDHQNYSALGKDKIMNALQKAAFLTLLPSIKKINCTESMFAFQEAFDIHIDHHEFSNYLDELCRKGMLNHAGIDTCGRCFYTLVNK